MSLIARSRQKAKMFLFVSHVWKILNGVKSTQGQTDLTTPLQNCSELESQAFYGFVAEASGFLSSPESDHWKHHDAPEIIAGSIPPSQQHQAMLEDAGTSDSLSDGERLVAEEKSEITPI